MNLTHKNACRQLRLSALILILPLLFCSRETVRQQEIRTDDYYRSVFDADPEILRSNIHGKISPHVVFSYRETWRILMDTDEDPDHPGNVILVYTRKSIPFEHNNSVDINNPDYWNREHVWPKSHGFKKEKMTPYTDLHHLKPADRTVNSSRGNKDFDFSDNAHREARNTKIDSDSFEPAPDVRGDVARMLFYMDVRYEGDNGEPDLILVDTVKTSGNHLGKLCTLLLWNEEDTVSSFERRRNDRVFKWQNNRNPFIDHPEWVSVLWGSKCRHK